MQIGTIESIWRYPVKGMRGEEIPHTYTAFTGLMGDRIYGAPNGVVGGLICLLAIFASSVFY